MLYARIESTIVASARIGLELTSRRKCQNDSRSSMTRGRDSRPRLNYRLCDSFYSIKLKYASNGELQPGLPIQFDTSFSIRRSIGHEVSQVFPGPLIPTGQPRRICRAASLSTTLVFCPGPITPTWACLCILFPILHCGEVLVGGDQTGAISLPSSPLLNDRPSPAFRGCRHSIRGPHRATQHDRHEAKLPFTS